MLAGTNHTAAWTLLQNGDQQALLTLYNEHYVGLMNYGIKLTGNRELSNDCITQVLLKLWDARAKLPVVENVRSYLLTCLRNELLAMLKKESSRKSHTRQLVHTLDNAELSYEECLVQLQTNNLIRERLAKALDKLTERERELLKLRFFEDLDYDAIAERCHISKRTAYNILHNAIRSLKAEFPPKSHLSIVYNKAMMLTLLLSLFS